MKKHIVANNRPWIFLVCLIISGTCAYLFFTYKPKSEDEVLSDPPAVLPVSFIETRPAGYPGLIRVYGEVRPEFDTSLRANVTGKVIWISSRFKQGMTLQQDELVVKIDPVVHESRVAQARLDLAQAKLDLLKEQQEAHQARKSWEQSGFKKAPASRLVLRQPQVNTARARIDAAQSALAAAEKKRGYCDIRAPFNSLVTQRSVTPGQVVASSDPVGSIQSTNKAVIQIHLDAQQWTVLAKEITKTRVTLYDGQTNDSWEANLVRDSKRLAPASRLRPLFCEVAYPLKRTPPLLSGSFLTVQLHGRKIDNLLKLPESCMTKQEKIWFKTPDNRLDFFLARPVFHKSGFVFVKAPGRLTFPLEVARFPTNAFVKGLKIRPRQTPVAGMPRTLLGHTSTQE